jgi:hypothetical protein
MLALACGDGKQEAAQLAAAAADSAAVTTSRKVDLGAHDMPLEIILPDAQLLGSDQDSVAWKEESGKLEVRAGEHFGLSISEEPADIERLKGDLERDLLRKNTVLRSGSDRIVYRSEFPDDPSLVFIHFYLIVQAQGRTFIVQDLDALRFNEQDVARMMDAVHAKVAV